MCDLQARGVDAVSVMCQCGVVARKFFSLCEIQISQTFCLLLWKRFYEGAL